MSFMVVFFDLFFDRVFHLVRIFHVHCHHAERVADEINREMVLHNLRIFLENAGLFRVLDMGLNGDNPFGLHRLR